MDAARASTSSAEVRIRPPCFRETEQLVALGDELTTTLHLERERALVAAIETGKEWSCLPMVDSFHHPASIPSSGMP